MVLKLKRSKILEIAKIQKGKMNKIPLIGKINIKMCIAVAAMLPTMGIGVWIISDIINTVMTYYRMDNTYGLSLYQFIAHHINKIPGWIVPLMLGVVVSGFVFYKRKIVPSVTVGMAVIIASYFLFFGISKAACRNVQHVEIWPSWPIFLPRIVFR